jgi:DNA-binding transcriptional LysR family regulator
MDRLEAMSMLLAVVDAGSISAGARRLRAPLASVSRKVAELERHLGTSLLIRTSRRIQLTTAGRAYVDCTRRILDQIGEAERLASGEYREPRGELSVTAPALLGARHLALLLAEFLGEFPRVHLRLDLSDRIVNLADEGFDVALRVGHLPDSELRATAVGQIEPILCASPHYLEGVGAPQTLAELTSHRRILLSGPVSGATPLLRSASGAPEIAAGCIVVNSLDAAAGAALAGLGIAELPRHQIASELRTGTLRPILSRFRAAPVPVSLVYGGASLVPLKLRAFVDWTAPRLRLLLAGARDGRVPDASPPWLQDEGSIGSLALAS